MVPATFYGPGSDIDLETAHVIGALISKFSDAVKSNQQKVSVWGTGNPCREFLYADDFVEASLYLMDHYDGDQIVNTGYGSDIAIKDLAEMIARITGFKGKIIFDETKPDGTMKKLLDSNHMTSLGWKPVTSLEEGIHKTYQWYVNRNV